MPRNHKKESEDSNGIQLSIFDLLNSSTKPVKPQFSSNAESDQLHPIHEASKKLTDSEASLKPDSIISNQGKQLFVPERFDILEKYAQTNELKTIIFPVEDALQHLDSIYVDMQSARRGAFWIVRGTSGAGKSTFLHTVNLFRPQVKTYSIESEQPIPEVLRKNSNYFKEILNKTDQNLIIHVIENREALTDFSEKQLEKDLHSINKFIRSSYGENNLVVWPCNSDQLQEILVNLSQQIGADSLLGIGEPRYQFKGPPKTQYLEIANLTIETFNEGASFVDLGVSEECAQKLLENVTTIGEYLSYLRKEILNNENNVKTLISQNRCRMWTVVIAGNDPEQEVAALTRGGLSKADIASLMSSTQANIVEDLRNNRESVGILSTVLDAKILYMPIVTALALVRTYASEELRNRMKDKNMSLATNKNMNIKERLMKSELGKAFQSQSRGVGRPGYKPGEDTQKSFKKLLEIAQKNDELVNKAIGEALKDCQLISDFDTEVDLRGKTSVRSDLLCQTESAPVRLELMWHKNVSRAQIANYVLKKLENYGKAIGLLQ